MGKKTKLFIWIMGLLIALLLFGTWFYKTANRRMGLDNRQKLRLTILGISDRDPVLMNFKRDTTNAPEYRRIYARPTNEDWGSPLSKVYYVELYAEEVKQIEGFKSMDNLIIDCFVLPQDHPACYTADGVDYIRVLNIDISKLRESSEAGGDKINL